MQTLPGAEEVGIIGNKFVFLAERLPLDDIAPMMLERKLVTAREYAGYHIRKTAPEKSEYLLECLKRRPAGSLKVFCDILREIEPAAHLAKLLEQSTKAQGQVERICNDVLINMILQTNILHFITPIDMVS